jgi:hypothetical protein
VQDVSQSFGGLGPSEAARLRWEKERVRNAEQEAAEIAGVNDVIVRTTVPVASIIKRLSADAQKGSHQAARELRAWLADVVVESRTDVSDLDERTRQALLARLLDEIEEEGIDLVQAGSVVEVEPPAPDGGATPADSSESRVTTGGALIALDGAETPAASAASETNGAPSQNEPLDVRT